MNDREAEIRAAIKTLRPLKSLPFETVIRALCDVAVLPFDTDEDAAKRHLDLIKQACQIAAERVIANPIKRPRPNEVGNDMEAFVISGLHAVGLSAASPQTRQGGGRATGYPDILVDAVPSPIYLEVKTYARETHKTSMRAFYLSPSDNPKVTCDAHHLLVGFEMHRDGDLFTPTGFELVDLYGMECDLKAEFNSSNARIYGSHRKLFSSRLS